MKQTLIVLILLILGGIGLYLFTPYQQVWFPTEPIVEDNFCKDKTGACIDNVHVYNQATLSNYDLQRYKGMYVLTLNQ